MSLGNGDAAQVHLRDESVLAIFLLGRGQGSLLIGAARRVEVSTVKSGVALSVKKFAVEALILELPGKLGRLFQQLARFVPATNQGQRVGEAVQ